MVFHSFFEINRNPGGTNNSARGSYRSVIGGKAISVRVVGFRSSYNLYWHMMSARNKKEPVRF
jgi:hypothetical protein